MNRVRTAVLVSGSGTNLQALLDAAQAGQMPGTDICLVISSKPGVMALSRAENHGVKAMAFDTKALGTAETERRILHELAQEGVELVVLAGFLMILSPAFVARYAGRIVNVHPSLLPAFGGVGMYGLKVHEAALKRGVKVTGATVHLVTDEADAGPILLQKAVRVCKGDTPQSLQKRVMEQAEWQLLPRAVHQLSQRILKERYHAQT